jgi:hypothetical protein
MPPCLMTADLSFRALFQRAGSRRSPTAAGDQLVLLGTGPNSKEVGVGALLRKGDPVLSGSWDRPTGTKHDPYQGQGAVRL